MPPEGDITVGQLATFSVQQEAALELCQQQLISVRRIVEDK